MQKEDSVSDTNRKRESKDRIENISGKAGVNFEDFEPKVSKTVTLVDQVEEHLFEFITRARLEAGDAIPNESELSEALGVSRGVLREALSRLRMMGIIESRTRRGMILSKPDLFCGLKRLIHPKILDDETLIHFLELRVALEMGIVPSIFDYVNEQDIHDLESIVEGENCNEYNVYRPESEHLFHSRLYEITRNERIIQFVEIIYPVCRFVREKFEDHFLPISRELKRDGNLVTHQELLQFIRAGDRDGFRKSLERHFELYYRFLRSRKPGAFG